MASRNKGIFEPEFRLPLLLLLALPSGFGYLGWGLAVNSRQPWIAPVICFGLIGFGLTFGLTISSAYLVDSFGDASTSALNAMQVLKVRHLLHTLLMWHILRACLLSLVYSNSLALVRHTGPPHGSNSTLFCKSLVPSQACTLPLEFWLFRRLFFCYMCAVTIP